MSTPLRIGTRGSPLALTQAATVASALRQAHDWPAAAVQIVPVRTTGDRIQDRPLADVGGKALWTRELDRALADGEIDIAVHSMKDVETLRPPTIVRAAYLPRADVRDRLIGAHSLAALPAGARLGTSSPRRSAQVRRLRPDLEIVMFRGNVDTRLAKLAAGEAEATLLAAAGLDRLGRRDTGTPIPAEVLLPAPAQGVVGIETLVARRDLVETLGCIDDQPTRTVTEVERAFLAALGADCRSPVAALATLADGSLRLRAELLMPDGTAHVTGERVGPASAGVSMAQALAAWLLRQAPAPLAALFTGP